MTEIEIAYNIQVQNEVIDYINGHDIFWLHELRVHLNVADGINSSDDFRFYIMYRVIDKLQKHGSIQCIGKRKTFRQYYRPTKLEPITTFNTKTIFGKYGRTRIK